jgi:hypothetical protein
MTRTERQDLARLVRQRARSDKASVEQRRAELLADFDEQLARIYTFDEDTTWKAAYEMADAAVKEAQATVEARCRELGIPKEFSPSVQIGWHERGQNVMARRRQELRRAAVSRLNAMEAGAKTAIERASVEAQTQLVADGLTSEAARGFLAALPTIATLMPALSAKTVAAEIEVELEDET